MNIVIVLLLAWRVYAALPFYLSILGYGSEEKVDAHTTDWETLLQIIAYRALVFLFDWSLYRFIRPWPIDFFFRVPASPTSWRRTVGFRDKEIVVRVSRRWDQNLPPNWLDDQNGKGGEIFQERIMAAIKPAWLQGKTGYLMMDKSWDLDFGGMITAHELVASGQAQLENFRTNVIIHSDPFGWLVWPVHKLDTKDETRRKKIVAFKDRLTAMGKENLFFKWIEIVQDESSQKGGFTEERQAAAMARAKGLFEAQGVDFEEFWRMIGGSEGMPGLETTR